MKNSSRAAFVVLAALAFASLPRPAAASFSLTISPLNSNFTWGTAVDPSSTTATVTYRLYRKFGISSDPTSGGTLIGTTFSPTTGITFGGKLVGSNCYVVTASDTVSGVFDTSVIQCHSYLHDSSGGNHDGITRVDGNGQQLGFNQTWNLGYWLDADSYVTMYIYPPGTTFSSAAASGLIAVDPSVPPITAKVVEFTPRSGELADGSWKNTEIWDSRNSSGATVGNGIYFAYVVVDNPLLSPATQYSEVFTIPVDIIRFTAFTTSGITPTVSLANINYTITGDATVRIVIAQPGRRFTYDANGDVQSLNAAGTAIDTSTTSVIQVMTFNRRAGSYTETWNGTDSSGVNVSSGIYSVGLSARDGFGNRALDLSGNDGPLAGTIPIDRQASQGSGDTTPPTVTGITVGGTSISLTGGTSVGAFTTIAITLNETAGTGANLSTVLLTGPGGSIAGGNVSASGAVVTYSTGTMSSTGTYTLTVTARDLVGNATAATAYNFVVSASGGGGGAVQTSADFAATVVPYPNPARTAPAKVDFTLAAAATVDIDIYTILGQRVFHQTSPYAAGSQTFNWNLVNDAANSVASGVYIVRVTATSSQQKLKATKKIMVIR